MHLDKKWYKYDLTFLYVIKFLTCLSATTNFFQKRATTKSYRWTKYKECPAAAAATEVKLADSEVDLVWSAKGVRSRLLEWLYNYLNKNVLFGPQWTTAAAKMGGTGRQHILYRPAQVYGPDISKFITRPPSLPLCSIPITVQLASLNYLFTWGM